MQAENPADIHPSDHLKQRAQLARLAQQELVGHLLWLGGLAAYAFWLAPELGTQLGGWAGALCSAALVLGYVLWRLQLGLARARFAADPQRARQRLWAWPVLGLMLVALQLLYLWPQQKSAATLPQRGLEQPVGNAPLKPAYVTPGAPEKNSGVNLEKGKENNEPVLEKSK